MQAHVRITQRRRGNKSACFARIRIGTWSVYTGCACAWSPIRTNRRAASLRRAGISSLDHFSQQFCKHTNLQRVQNIPHLLAGSGDEFGHRLFHQLCRYRGKGRTAICAAYPRLGGSAHDSAGAGCPPDSRAVAGALGASRREIHFRSADSGRIGRSGHAQAGSRIGDAVWRSELAWPLASLGSGRLPVRFGTGSCTGTPAAATPKEQMGAPSGRPYARPTDRQCRCSASEGKRRTQAFCIPLHREI